ncbi:unnamed protein product [Euphydryas editha]|uniref:Uncharacterized protein n=1 Tax=Euphydryas editha TaxID=104508 RepID=A0AAU9VCW9_EUPED|nr:unnamed protein product [Euphydryas editha]
MASTDEASSAQCVEKIPNSSLHSDLSKQLLKDGVVYYENLLLENDCKKNLLIHYPKMLIIYPPYEEERNEQKFDNSERKKAEKYARSNDEVLLTDALGIRPRTLVEPAPLAQVIEGRVITESTKKALEGIEGNSKLWIGKDYVNFIVEDFNSLDMPFVDLVDRNTTPRMPWHDVGVVVQGAAARDVARHFIQRWNAIKLEKAR